MVKNIKNDNKTKIKSQYKLLTTKFDNNNLPPGWTLKEYKEEVKRLYNELICLEY